MVMRSLKNLETPPSIGHTYKRVRASNCVRIVLVGPIGRETEMTEYLGAQKVNRSAYAVKEATALTSYHGICPRDNRPVKFEMPVALGPPAAIPCFPRRTLPATVQRPPP